LLSIFLGKSESCLALSVSKGTLTGLISTRDFSSLSLSFSLVLDLATRLISSGFSPDLQSYTRRGCL